MTHTLRPRRPPAYDPNLLFDELLRRLQLEDDDALAQRLHIGRDILFRIRRGEVGLGAALLIRVSERCAIPVAELRRMAGDRRAEFRLEEGRGAGGRTPQPTRAGARREQTGLIRDDPGLPANVQWT
ncbi:hypothetical protein [Noviherbaspirillum aridicola]|uniref:HTH cro/C1-type domain-containing protein n=1 Tax=Noviherbaspirillum aridicola TaxID=2849687 RepID=A0ABQ4Q302_9BURK|nr:hypothetical protein [Noviherbaspirillum aridicola]GIZ51563.1 hypothetical protein NCCP691_15770 [Noviherbaspirillum aridicola]